MKVEKRVAPDTSQMVVSFRGGVESSGATQVADSRYDAEIHEQIENTVDGHPRHVGQTTSDILVDPVGSGVVLAVRYRF